MLKLLASLSAVAVLSCLAGWVSGCASSRETGEVGGLPIAVFDRGVTDRDLRGGPLGQAGLVVETSSVRRVGVANRRYVLWAFNARQTVGANPLAGAAFSRLCLQLVAAREHRVLATQCIAREQASTPGALLVALSGGAQGAPGFGPGEAVIAGLVPRSVESVGLVGERAARERVRVRDLGFVFETQRVVSGVLFASRTGSFEARVDACQLC